MFHMVLIATMTHCQHKPTSIIGTYMYIQNIVTEFYWLQLQAPDQLKNTWTPPVNLREYLNSQEFFQFLYYKFQVTWDLRVKHTNMFQSLSC